jgi:hypothetical protein
MDRYLIETPHTGENCKLLVSQVHAIGYLHHFDWGCADGVHCGWAIIEAESEEQARLAVPSIARDAARVIRLAKYSSDLVEDLHE